MAIKLNENSYYDNLILMVCSACQMSGRSGEFIIGENQSLLKRNGVTCPYCGGQNTQETARTTDDTRSDIHLSGLTLFYKK